MRSPRPRARTDSHPPRAALAPPLISSSARARCAGPSPGAPPTAPAPPRASRLAEVVAARARRRRGVAGRTRHVCGSQRGRGGRLRAGAGGAGQRCSLAPPVLRGKVGEAGPCPSRGGTSALPAGRRESPPPRWGCRCSAEPAGVSSPPVG